MVDRLSSLLKNVSYSLEKVSEYDQGIPQSHTADQPMAPCADPERFLLVDEGREDPKTKTSGTLNGVWLAC